MAKNLSNMDKYDVQELLDDNKKFAEFINDNQMMLYKIIQKFCKRSQDPDLFEDYYSLALAATWRALKYFINSRAKLSTFIWHCVKNDLGKLAKKNNKDKIISFNCLEDKLENQSVDHVFVMSNAFLPSYANNMEETIVNNIYINAKMSLFSKYERRIIEMFYVEKRKHSEIAEELGMGYYKYKNMYNNKIIPKIKRLKKVVELS